MSSPSTSPTPPEPADRARWRQDAHNRLHAGDNATEEQARRLLALDTALAAAEQTLAEVRQVHDTYFDTDVPAGHQYADPEPEDVWRFDRDLRAALARNTGRTQ